MEYSLAILQQYTYFILFPLSIVEGPIITVIASFLSAQHILNIYIVYPILVLGDVIGDLLHYYLGKYGRHTIIPKFGKYIGITDIRISKVESHFSKKKLWKTVFFGKFTRIPNSIILVTAGVVNVNIWRYIMVAGSATLIKTFLLVLIGWYLGTSYLIIGELIDGFGYFMIGVACVAIPVIWFKNKKLV